VADYLLFDAKAPRSGGRPGGSGTSFDWSLLGMIETKKPWLLAGGLDAGNVADALAQTGAPGVDVSSGVENAPGAKDRTKIGAFIAAARGAAEKLGPSGGGSANS
jgi:phosphoribosylanthranilate isomerase